jgi:hypothetical protein
VAKDTGKFNNSLLDNNEYKTFISSQLKAIIQRNISPYIKWELCKTEIRNKTVEFSKKCSRNRHNLLNKLENELKSLYELNELNQTEERSTRIAIIESELKDIYINNAKGAQIRSRVDFIEKGETNSKYFLSLEKSRQCKKVITSLKVDGKRVHQTQDILNAEVKFYQELYTSNFINDEQYKQYINRVNFKSTLDPDLADICEGKITYEEATTSIKEMKLNKSPGLDGLTVEFYQSFWHIIGNVVVSSLNYGYEIGQLSFSQKQAVFSLLYKKGDTENLENWRPISLLNIDYKIVAKILAKRLQTVLPKIISQDQQGYIKNRNISFNIRQIEDIIDYTELFDLDGAILFLDFKKAFDTVEWPFMIDILTKVGFKQSFIRWIKTLYCNISSKIINNGWLSESFHLHRGIRQGCPLSALIFILVAEVLATNLRNNENYEGITINNNHLKVTQLADDTTLFLKSHHELPIILNIIDEFGKYSGLQLNRAKTNGLWIGKSKHNDCTVTHDIKLTSDKIKSLGVYFGNDKNECVNLSWNEKIEKCQQLINSWNKRKLTMFGKITVIKSLLLPKFVYLAQNIFTPDSVIKTINSMLFKFLWNNKRDKIKRTTIIGNKMEGGIEMPDFNFFSRTMKLKWIKYLTNTVNANWKIIPTTIFNKFGNNFLIFYMNLDSLKSLPFNINTVTLFYRHLLKTWIQFKQLPDNQSKLSKTYYNIRNEIIWGNKFIKVKNKTIIFKNWIDSDILFINDIISNTGLIDENIIFTKLKTKNNWIAEVNIIKKAIPNIWKEMIKTDQSIKTKVKTKLLLTVQNKHLKDMTNKQIYQIYIKQFYEKPYIHGYWNRRFNENICWNSWYFIIHRDTVDNKVKQFKIKLLHNLVATNLNLFTWKLKDTPLCDNCQEVEDYEHFFIRCPALTNFWIAIDAAFKACGMQRTFRNLRYLVIGYKIDQKEYNIVNIVLSQIAYCIYKTYFISDRRTKHINIMYHLFNDLTVLQTVLKPKLMSLRFLNDFVKNINVNM